MAAIAGSLTLVEFEEQFGDKKKPHFEYLAGIAIQKSMPTWVHGFLQKILMRLVDELGLLSACEIRVNISQELELVPDVIVTNRRVSSEYAITPPLLVIEILSPSGPVQRLWTKCEAYLKWGVATAYVVDPEARKVRVWNHALDSFTTVTEIQATGYGGFLWSGYGKN